MPERPDESQMTEKEQGRVVKWNDQRGFGFVSPEAGGDDVFIHISDFPRDVRRPAKGDRVVFVRDTTARRPKASSARLLGLSAPQWSRTATVATSLVTFVYGIALLGVIHLPPVLLGYMTLSLLTFFFFWADKKRAERGLWRINETTFHTLEVLGGWPGALLAQQALRHKTQKHGYQVRFWVISGVHAAVWTALLLWT